MIVIAKNCIKMNKILKTIICVGILGFLFTHPVSPFANDRAPLSGGEFPSHVSCFMFHVNAAQTVEETQNVPAVTPDASWFAEFLDGLQQRLNDMSAYISEAKNKLLGTDGDDTGSTGSETADGFNQQANTGTTTDQTGSTPDSPFQQETPDITDSTGALQGSQGVPADSNMESWWDKFKNALGFENNTNPNTNQGTGHNTQSNNPPVSAETQASGSPKQVGETIEQQNNAASSGAQGSHENGSQKYPYHLEPNQFKKICGENTYVLWWSKRGSDGKDLDEVKDKMQNSYLTIPSCDKLAECHCCCCDQCTHPRSSPCPPGFCFSVNSCCDSETEETKCNTICGPKCDPCNKHCESYKDPFHTTPFQTDCQCEQKGCPDGKGCKIVLFTVDSGWEWARYDRTKNWALETHVETGKKPVYVDNSKDVVTLRTWGKDPKNPHGWVDRLVQDKGQCCKCVDKSKAEKGPP